MTPIESIQIVQLSQSRLILGDTNKINLDNTLVSFSSVDVNSQMVVHPKILLAHPHSLWLEHVNRDQMVERQLWNGIQFLKILLFYFIFFIFFQLNGFSIVTYPYLTTCYHGHSSCYGLINYQLFFIFFFFLSHILLVIFHGLLVIHSLAMSYPCIATSYLSINQLLVIFYIHFFIMVYFKF